MDPEPLEITLGLHRIGGQLSQLSHCQYRAEEILQNIKLWIEATEQQVIPRDAFFLARENVGGVHQGSAPEDKLNRSLWQLFHASNGIALLQQFCGRIVSYEVPAANGQGWGAADLLGIDPHGLPLVIELKSDNPSKESAVGDNPLRMAIEGIAYAIAFRRQWPLGLRDAWSAATGKKELPKQLDSVHILGLAPADYWNRVVGGSGSPRTRGQFFDEAREPLSRLLAAFEKHGYRVKFAELLNVDWNLGQIIDSDFLPTVGRAKLISFPD